MDSASGNEFFILTRDFQGYPGQVNTLVGYPDSQTSDIASRSDDCVFSSYTKSIMNNQ